MSRQFKSVSKQIIMKNFLWNMFAHLKNGQKSRRDYIRFPYKKICERFLKILWVEGFILGYTIENKKTLKIFLKYKQERPVINSLNLISKPSRKIYFSIKQIWKIDSNKYFLIFSTNKGLKSINDCKKQKIGGEPILIIN